MKIKIMYFAQLRDAVGSGEEIVRVEGPLTVGEFFRRTLERPEFKKFGALPFRYAMNDEFVGPDQSIEDGATLALLPPVAGG